MELKAQIQAITGAAKEESAAEAEAEGVGPLVTDQDIANIVAQWTGIPVEKARRSARAETGAVLQRHTHPNCAKLYSGR
jgi:ATP-dependent Clp protease ATP-binding subunit ClpA